MEITDISLRKREKGGGLRETAVTNLVSIKPSETLILLVHGYNVSKQKAEKSYRDFRYQVQMVSGNKPLLALNLAEVYWPGDESFGPISLIKFHTKIPVAIKTGERLEQALYNRKFNSNVPVNLILIGHSLGCRVILEMLRAIVEKKHTAEYNVRVFLMAAGIPVQMVEPNGRLRQAVEFAKDAYVYHSLGDEALFVFPVGQWLAGEEGITIFEAVGQRGKPIGKRPNGIWTESYKQELLHGDYWISPKVAAEVLFSMGILTSRPIEDRNIRTNTGPKNRRLAFWRTLETRGLSDRKKR